MKNVQFEKGFSKIMNKKQYNLPIEYKNKDYNEKLKDLLDEYQNDLDFLLEDAEREILRKICKYINQAVTQYYLGFPSDAYEEINKLMDELIKDYWGVLRKSNNKYIDEYVDPLKLYRAITFKGEHETTSRGDLFHLPYNLRNNASSARYSISGYPSLYLGTSLELCFSEVNGDTSLNGWVSKYKLDRNSNNKIFIYDLAVKPSDFSDENKVEEIVYWTDIDINKTVFKKNYVYWYPLIASMSFIRKNKKENFAPEYIIPQLFLQWVRKKSYENSENDRLYGVRYFSCSSVEASKEEYNYVFPVSGKTYEDTEYCKILSEAFELTTPFYVKDADYKEATDYKFLWENSKITISLFINEDYSYEQLKFRVSLIENDNLRVSSIEVTGQFKINEIGKKQHLIIYK